MNLAKELPAISKRPFGETSGGKAVMIYSLINQNGAKVDITNYGGTITGVVVPDREGNFGDVVLGFHTLQEYEKDSPYFGCIIGRYGNRIAGAEFSIGDKKYELAKNNDPGGMPCHLHGGVVGFDKVIWDAVPLIKKNAAGLKLNYLSQDGEQGYPGNLKVEVQYWWTDQEELKIEYHTTTDKPTPVNLTNHSYFNLKGEGRGDILDHILILHAEKYTPVNKGLIPTGDLASVKGTPFDFLKPTAIGERIGADNEQLKFGGGYDHNWVLNKNGEDLTLAAEVYEPKSGRILEVWTTEPGLQFYSGNFLHGSLKGKKGNLYPVRSGFCLETQHFPDSPNQSDFPSTILNPGEIYRSKTIYKFGVAEQS